MLRFVLKRYKGKFRMFHVSLLFIYFNAVSRLLVSRYNTSFGIFEFNFDLEMSYQNPEETFDNGTLSFDNPNYNFEVDYANLKHQMMMSAGARRNCDSSGGNETGGVDATSHPNSNLDVKHSKISPVASADVKEKRKLDNLNEITAMKKLNDHYKPSEVPSRAFYHSLKPDIIVDSNKIEKESTYEKPTPPVSLKLSAEKSANNDEKEKESPNEKKHSENSLPLGWEMHKDNEGPYYWHIKSGTIQRERPDISCEGKNEPKTPLVKEAESLLSSFQNMEMKSFTRNKPVSNLSADEERRKREHFMMKRRSYPINFDCDYREKRIRFTVRSLGWLEVAEEDLTLERSSKVVNKCILELSQGGSTLELRGKWGGGKDLFLDLDEGALKLLDPATLSVLNSQPIHTVRVWGVGREAGRDRDFAYIARDRLTKVYMCHVFRCENPARQIANALRDVCKKIMIERNSHQGMGKSAERDVCSNKRAIRPTNLPMENRRNYRSGCNPLTPSFPTPMDEPKKIMPAKYLGYVHVSKASGMDVLNEAIDSITASKCPEDWETVNVAIAPSTITIVGEKDRKIIKECRVRFLSFLGIGRNAKQCAFIMHTSHNEFVAHVFWCEPSSGSLCKTIEAACKLRFQKCLDAHPIGGQRYRETPQNKGFGATFRSLVGTLTGRKDEVES